MVRTGKERASSPEHPEAPETVQDARWLNGVNRQLRPDAPTHQQVASEAAASKRKANVLFGTWSAVALGGRSVRVHGVASEGR